MSGKKNNMIVQAAILTFSGILVRIIGILYRSPLTAIIGDEGNGIYSAAYNIYTMVLLIASYSIPSAISKVIAARLALKQYKNAHRVFQCALIYVLIIGGGASLLTFIFADFLVTETAVLPLRILSPAIFLSGILGVFRGYFQAYNSMTQTSISQIIEQIINAVVSIGAAYFLTKPYVGTAASDKVPLYGAAGSTLGTLAGVLVALLFMAFVYYLNRSFFQKKIKKDHSKKVASYKSIFRTIFFMVTPVIFSTFIYNISTSLDMKIYYHICMEMKNWSEAVTSVHYGIFSGKYVLITNIPIAFASAMSSAIIPNISANFAKQDYEATKDKVAQAIRFTMLIAIPAAVGISVLSYQIVGLLFPQPESMQMASDLIKVGSTSVIFYSLSTLTNAVLQGIGKVNIPVKNAVISLIAHLAILVPLLIYTELDLYILVLANITYSVIMCILNAHSVGKYLSYKQELKKTFIIPIVSSLIMGLITWSSYKAVYYVTSNNILGLAISIIASCIVYFIVMIKLKGVTEQDLRSFPKGGMLIRLAKKFKLL